MFVKFARHYPLIMRLSLFFVFIYFGISEILNPVYFSGYLPPFVVSFPFFNSDLFIQTHGIVLTLLSICLFCNFKLRTAGLISIIMLLQIIGGLLLVSGFNEIVVRDIGLFGLALAIWLQSFSSNR